MLNNTQKHVLFRLEVLFKDFRGDLMMLLNPGMGRDHALKMLSECENACTEAVTGVVQVHKKEVQQNEYKTKKATKAH